MNIAAFSTPNNLTELASTSHATAWRRTKITLRMISLALAVAALTEGFMLLPTPNPIISPLLPIAFSFACISWNCTVLTLTHTGRAWMKKVHPAHIAIETLLWMIGFGATAMQASSINASKPATESSTSSASVSTLMSALIGSLAVLSISHLILSVRACVESRRRKRDKRVQQLLQILVQDSQRSTNLSTPTPASCYQSSESLYRSQQNSLTRNRLSQAAELPSKNTVVELAAVSGPVELPGDHDFFHAHELKSSQ